MTVKSLSHSSLEDNRFYRSMLAGNTAFSPSAYDLLETQVLSSSAASVTFTGLGSYSDYKHLQIRAVARSDRSSSVDNIAIRLNSDSGSNYAYHQLYGDGSSVLSTGSNSQSLMTSVVVSAASDTANAFGFGVIDILDFSSASKNTTIRSLSGQSSTYTGVFLRSGLWVNTSAVTSIELFAQTGPNIVANSRFSLYGIR